MTRNRPQDTEPVPAPDDPRHGTLDGYNKIPCHHPCCRAALAAYRRRWHTDRILGKTRRVDATGTRRRLQALACLGWSTNTLVPYLKLSNTRIRYLQRTPPGTTIHTELAARVAKVYDQLAMRIPTGHPRSASQARDRALAAGWIPPLGWDDEDLDRPKAKPRTRPTPRKDPAA